MAKGLIKDSTLTAIADLIREKEETTEGILPADMEPRLRALLEAGSFNVMSGSATPSANTETLNLGATLPESDNYLFICIAEIFAANSTLSVSTNLYTHYIRRAVVINKDGTKSGETSRTLYQGSGTTEYSSWTDTNFGILSGDSVSVADEDNYIYRFRQSVVYRWWYAYV